MLKNDNSLARFYVMVKRETKLIYSIFHMVMIAWLKVRWVEKQAELLLRMLNAKEAKRHGTNRFSCPR